MSNRLPELDQSGGYLRTCRRTSSPPQATDELTTPGDYHLPFGKVEAERKAVKWLWQVYII
jgi:hypothetical protein